jgi:tetratricopeptide (TPR) repeat protein
MIIAIILLLIFFILAYMVMGNSILLNRYLGGIVGIFEQPQTMEEQLKASIMLADDYYESKKYNLAEKEYIHSLSLDEHNSYVYNRLGMLYSFQNNVIDSIESFKFAVENDPKNPLYKSNLGLSALKDKQYGLAIENLESVCLEDPNISRIISLARAYKGVNRFEDGLTLLVETKTNDKKEQISLYNLMGEICIEAGNITMGEDVLRKSLALDKKNKITLALVKKLSQST